MVFGLFGVVWVMPQSVLALLGCWKGIFGRHCKADVLGCYSIMLMWITWKEHNNRMFNGTDVYMKMYLFRTLYDWMAVLSHHSFFDLLEFLDLCTFIWFLTTLVPCPCTVVVLYLFFIE